MKPNLNDGSKSSQNICKKFASEAPGFPTWKRTGGAQNWRRNETETIGGFFDVSDFLFLGIIGRRREEGGGGRRGGKVVVVVVIINISS